MSLKESRTIVLQGVTAVYMLEARRAATVGLSNFENRINEEISTEYSLEKQAGLIQSERMVVEDALKRLHLRPDSDEAQMEMYVRTRIEDALSRLNLDAMEFSSQKDIDVLDDAIQKSKDLLVDLEAFKSSLREATLVEFSKLMSAQLSKSEANREYWKSIYGRFSHALNDKFDNKAFVHIIQEFEEWFDRLHVSLERVKDTRYPIGQMILADMDGSAVKSMWNDIERHFVNFEVFGKKRIVTLEELKATNDQNKQDVNLKWLLRAILEGDNELRENNVYELIQKRQILLKKLAELHRPLGVDSSVRNLVTSIPEPELSRRLKLVYELFEGTLIENTSYETFACIFMKGKFRGPVEWKKGNRELNHFIIKIKKVLLDDPPWGRASNCFINDKGKAMSKESIRNPGVNNDILPGVQETLDKAIAIMKGEK